jgi:GAF domain-containing protein
MVASWALVVIALLFRDVRWHLVKRLVIAASRDELGMLAELQASLRRVATLVAQGVTPSEVFSAAAEELARVRHCTLFRYEADGVATLLAARHEHGSARLPFGSRFSLEGENVAAMVLHGGRAARMDNHANASGSAAANIRALGVRSAVGAPIVVDGQVWGVAIVGSSRPEPLPPDTEARVGDFADLVATAIANAQTRAELTASRARIVAAHRDLRSANPSHRSVASIAHRWGFTHLGRFAAAHKTMFGETPRQALRAAR